MQVGSLISSGIPQTTPLAEARPQGSKSAQGVPFAQLMSNLLQDANQQQLEVNQQVQQFITGQSDNIHEIAISMAQADVTFRLVMEVRDQLISAYQDVMRMQV